jgi:hypothetical protein
VSRFLITLALGLLWPILQKIDLGRLPDDIIILREHTTSDFPVVTSIVVSLVLSLIFWLINR